ncbi:hypothetical protein MRX96_026159, partial [Rhipicephalus microplus]
STVVDCKAVYPASYALAIFNHKPVVVSFEVNDRLSYRHPWRVDNRLLNGETARAGLRNRLAASIGNYSWDTLKQACPPGPKALNATTLYSQVKAIYRRISTLYLDTPLLEIRDAELSRELLVNSGCEAKDPGFSWVLLTPSRLPVSSQDVMWNFRWSILPTADRMYRWHLVHSEHCVHCREHEDNEHSLLTCCVAATFWYLVGGAHRSLGLEWFLKRDRCPNGAQARLVLAAGMISLWENRSVAVSRR